MTRDENIALVETYFSAMAAGNWSAVEAMYHDDIVVHMAGSTPASGRIAGKAALTDEMIAAQVHAALVPEEMRFARRWRVMCADEGCVCVIMEGGGPTVSGDRYDQTYCEIFRFKGGRIIELYAFFDTALAERALFGNPLLKPRSPAPPLDY